MDGRGGVSDGLFNLGDGVVAQETGQQSQRTAVAVRVDGGGRGRVMSVFGVAVEVGKLARGSISLGRYWVPSAQNF